MFRRRGMRPFRRAIVPDIPPMLQRANELLAIEDYNGAAAAFEQLARAAEVRNGPRAPMLFLQAGRARVLAGNTGTGIEHFKHGLELFARRGQSGKVYQAGTRIIGELNQLGSTKEAAELEAYMQEILPGLPKFAETPVPAKHPPLPVHCPSCGAAVRPDEVEWLDDATAECAYCGSPVRGEK